MRIRSFLFVVSLFLTFCFLAEASFAPTPRSSQVVRKNDVPESCPVTKPPAHPFVPPLPYPDETRPGYFAIGTPKLWIYLRTDGRWQDLPQWSDGSFRQKLIWWRDGYDWRRSPHPPLNVTGNSLDFPSQTLRSDVSHGWTNDADHPFITNGINLPAQGCWKIRGRFEDDVELSFIVWVTR
jgi:hypothetical protein